MARVVWQMGVTTNRYIAGPGGEGEPDHGCWRLHRYRWHRSVPANRQGMARMNDDSHATDPSRLQQRRFVLEGSE